MTKHKLNNQLATRAELYTKIFVSLGVAAGLLYAAFCIYIIVSALSGPAYESQWIVILVPPFTVLLIASLALSILALTIQFTASMRTCKKLLIASLVLIVILGLSLITAVSIGPIGALPFITFLVLGWLDVRLIGFINKLL